VARRATIRTWALVGLLAQVVFVAGWLLAGLWQGPGYDPVRHTISDMYAVGAPNGLFLVVVLTLCGLGTVLFALLGLRPALRGSGWAGIVGPVLLALSILGVGDLLSPFERQACRLADPGCTSAAQVANAGGGLDSMLSSIGLALLVTAGFVLAAAMGRLPGWRGLVLGTRVGSGVLVVLLLAALFVPGASGLIERLLAAAAAAGVAVLAAATHRRAAQAVPTAVIGASRPSAAGAAAG
jgi:hypothetical protein